ncbi:MAG TPA: 2-oxoglutarate dehydrogenase E1 component, partial [Candidatus Tenderia electrophaga]|nr:2-oxoglutarate dehydrogenase E1 component [Candidatus Tenderia electrophaga]
MRDMGQENSKDRYQRLLAQSYLSGGNAAFVEALYERYLQDPSSVEPRWHDYFDQLQLDSGPVATDVSHTAVKEEFYKLAHSRPSAPSTNTSGAAVAVAASKQVAVLQLINAYRVRGHQQAILDPLGLQEQNSIS